MSRLGIYKSGDGDGAISSGESFPSGVLQRSDILWGVHETGSVTVTLVFNYSNVEGISNPSAIQLLKRSDASSAWTNVTLDYTHDTNNRTFTRTGVTEFSEFSVGDNGENPLPVTLSTFTVDYSNSCTVLNWTTQSESNNSHWNIYRSISSNYGQSEIVNSESIEGAGTTSDLTEYSYNDQIELIPAHSYWYWLECVDYSGYGELSNPVEITIPEEHETPPEIPTKFGLYSNYPNPFNPDTNISFALKEASTVSLKIFNIKGELVKTLLNNVLVQENRVIRTHWNGRDKKNTLVSSGIYFYQLKTETKTITKRMLLIK